MISGRNIKQMFKACDSNPRKFQSEFRKMLGITQDEKTLQWKISNPQIGADEFKIRELTEALLGQEYISECAGDSMSSSAAGLMRTSAGYSNAYELQESAVPVMPSTFQDISAWNATVGGLVEVRMLAGYRKPMFIGDNFVTTEPTRVMGGKVILIPDIAPAGEVVKPGVEFPNTGMNEQWVWARENMVYGLDVSLTREDIVYDLTGQLLAKAESIGAALGYGREYLIGAGVLGLTTPPMTVTGTTANIKTSLLRQIGSSYRLNESSPTATPQATYQTTPTLGTSSTLPNAYNYINQLSGGPFVDWTSLQAVRQQLYLQRDPVNNLPFDMEISTLFVDPYEWDVVARVLHASQVFNVTGNPATSYGPLNQGAGSTFPPVGTLSNGFPANSQLNGWTAHTSAIWHQILLDSGVSETNARKYWIAGDPKKAFKWRSAWDLRVDQANPLTSDLLKKNIVQEWVGQWSGQFLVEEPRRVILVTN